VYTISARGGDPVQLTSHGGNVGAPSWSPTDKNRLVYVLYTDLDEYKNYSGRLQLTDPTMQDSQPVTIITKTMYLGVPVWSPRGEYIAIGFLQGGYLVNMETLSLAPTGWGTKKWSPNGTALLFESIGGGISTAAMRRVYWIDIESPHNEHHAAEDFLDGKRFWQTNADWAPDMEQIVFAGLLNAPDPAP
jgi:Tol biopolymer transport system component